MCKKTVAKFWKSVTRCDQIDKLEVSLYYYGKYSIGNIYRKSLPKPSSSDCLIAV